jgi:RNA polymerase sigma-70 factor (ECF subfamily)
MVLRVGGPSETGAREALESLCRQYWYPLYAFVRWHGRSHHEAEDCVQAFLARFLAGEGMARADPEKGRFRSYLLASLRRFLANEARYAKAAKRNPGRPLLPLEWNEAQKRFAGEPADPALTPEQAFDREWARALVSRVVVRMREEFAAKGREDLFDEVRTFLFADLSGPSVADSARRLGMSRHAFSVALHRIRRKLGENLRSAVAETVDEPEDVDAELRNLIAALSEFSG